MSVAELPGPQELDEAQQAAVEELLFRMADDEFVLAERYTEWQVRAPTLESDLAIANIAQDEYGHARLWYDLLEDFGYEEPELIWERDPDDFRHATLVELPVFEGDWADTILRSYLFDQYEKLHLESLNASSYPRLRDRIEKVQLEERYHLEHGQNWLERLCDDDPGRERVQQALDRVLPYALTLFEPGDHEDAILEYGIRTEPLDSLRTQWLEIVVPFLTALGLDVPHDVDELPDVPAKTGRRGDHTDDWEPLYEDFTFTYRTLGLSTPTKLLKDPDDVK
ncbi:MULTISPECIES: 1,2-phenylacetyl-CoA epoxidase subunit PaaC [unclassified Haladaptatus]|uniref:1,2-phenylacetyl-CoA epoxidase subunit PaaC n=1 Tax=unclassified Haladaptatus TaxID=2622732 RepID=UPI0023E7ABC5|nr:MULTISPECIES: 1,2-phenylacetyl-CoA epoxidase subunit PaaC [unclassified Haladaptatus]